MSRAALATRFRVWSGFCAAVCVLCSLAAFPVWAAEEEEFILASSRPYAARYKAVQDATQLAASGKYAEAVAGLEKAAKLPADEKDFLRGKWLLAAGKAEKARASLQKVASGRSGLAAHAAWLLGQSFGTDCASAISWLEVALNGAGVRARALDRLGDCLATMGRDADAMNLYREWLAQIPNPDERQPLAVKFGRLLLKNGQRAGGLTLLTESWLADSGGRSGAAAALEEFYGEDWKLVALFKPLAEGAKRGVSQAQDIAIACPFTQSLLEGASARCSRNKETALQHFELALAKADRPLAKALALYLRGRALESLDRDLEARDVYGTILAEHPDFPASHSLLVRMGVISVREGLGVDAVGLLTRYLDGAVPGENIAEGLWQLAFIEHVQGRDTSARKLLERLETQFFYYTRSPWEYYGPMARFWRAACLKAEGREHAAAGLLESLAREFPSNYYGLLALSRGAKVGGVPAPAAYETSPLQVPPDLKLPANYLTAVELFRLGLWEEAYREYQAQLGLGHMAANVLTLTASAYFRTHSVGDAISFRRELGLLPPPWETGARLWRSSVRLAFTDAILAAARRSGLESALLAAVIRFESDYVPNLESHAGAVGLIQVKTNAGSDISKSCLGGGNVGKKELKDPNRNVLLGAMYISELVFRHHGNWAVALAAFNAGPGTARWWLGRFGGLDSDEFIEQLTFPNAIGYVKRILGVVNVYWSLYYPILGEAAPQAGLPYDLPRDLKPFLDEEGGRCKSQRPEKSEVPQPTKSDKAEKKPAAEKKPTAEKKPAAEKKGKDVKSEKSDKKPKPKESEKSDKKPKKSEKSDKKPEEPVTKGEPHE